MEIGYHEDVILYFVEGNENSGGGWHVESFQLRHLRGLSLHLSQ